MDPIEESIYVYDVAHVIVLNATSDAEASKRLKEYLADADDIVYITNTETKLVTILDPDGDEIYRDLRPFVPFDRDNPWAATKLERLARTLSRG